MWAAFILGGSRFGTEPFVSRAARCRVRRLCFLGAAALAVALLPAACRMSHIPSAAPATPGDTPATETVDDTVPIDSGSGDGARSVIVEPGSLNVTEGETASYAVALSAPPSGAVAVTVAESAPDLTVQPRELTFSAVDWESAKTVTVAASEDGDAVARAPVQLRHAVRGGGYDGTAAPSLTVIIVEDDVSTLAVAQAHALEQAGRIAFEVTVSLASDRLISVDYATGAASDSATEGQDYARAEGSLTFPVRSTAVRTIEVALQDDALDEPDEAFTLTLSNAEQALLAGGGATLTATGRIEDDDPLPRVGIEDAPYTRAADGVMRFAVRLQPASGRTVTVQYATADGSATAGADYTSASGTLTFAAGSTHETIAVVILDDEDPEETERFTVTLSSPTLAALSDDTATGTIAADGRDTSPLELESLQVTGGGAMYPMFDPATLHYALTCANAATLQVTAQAKRSDATVTLLRNNPDQNHTATGALNVQLTVDQDHDVAIQLSDTDGAVTYVAHCLPSYFPDIEVVKKLPGVTDGLLFLTPHFTIGNRRLLAIIDNNGVPRLHRRSATNNFRRQPDGPTINGKVVKYSLFNRLLDENFAGIRRVKVVSPLTSANAHDFLISERGFLLIAYHATTRDLSGFEDLDGRPLPSDAHVTDSVIQEVSAAGEELFRWTRGSILCSNLIAG